MKIYGIDFPFRPAETIGWSQSWRGYITHAAGLGKAGFEADLEAYAASRPDGDIHHFRKAYKRANSQSPQKLHFLPVGKMFFQGAPRQADVTIPGLQLFMSNLTNCFICTFWWTTRYKPHDHAGLSPAKVRQPAQVR